MTKLSKYLSSTRVEKDDTSIDLRPALKTVSPHLRFHRTSLMAEISATLRPSGFASSHLSSPRMTSLKQEISQNLFKIVVPFLENVPRSAIVTPVGSCCPCCTQNALTASSTTLSGGLLFKESGSFSLYAPNTVVTLLVE